MKAINIKLIIVCQFLFIGSLFLNAEEINKPEVKSVEERALESWPSSIDWFDKNFPEPVVFRGLAKSWQVMKLSYNYIYKKYPDSKFIFGIDLEEKEKFLACNADSEEDEIDGFFGKKPDGWPLSFKDFWNMVQSGEVKRYYQNVVCDPKTKETGIPYDLSMYLANLLENDKNMPEMFKNASSTTLFLSGPESIRMTHSHESVLLAQIEGRKVITLIPPDKADLLYVKHCKNGKDYKENGKACVSPVNLHDPDLERFPNFKEVHLYQVVLEPGDAMFIPEGWFHEVRVLDDSISLSFFYKN